MTTGSLRTPALAASPRRPPPSRRVVYLRDDDYPWDVRVEKICAAMTAAGHDVHIVARNRARARVRERLPEGTVHRMPPLSRFPHRIDAALGFPAFFNPRWLRHLSRVTHEVGADVLIVRDLPLAPTALWMGHRVKIPVVLDMAENYPALTRETWDAGRHRVADYLVRNPGAVAAVERWCLPHFDAVLVVVEESAARVQALGVARRRTYVVSNTPPRALAERAVARPPGTPGTPLELVYLGFLEIPRGVADVIDAVAELLARGMPVRATIIGDGRDASIFHDRARARRLSADVLRFTGFLPRDRALALVARADAGLVPHHANALWNSTIPNKLFDYMAAGVPVVTSDAVPAARIVRETGAGVVFRASDSGSLADAVMRLADPAVRIAHGEAGRHAVATRYYWERDRDVLLAAIEDVVASCPGGVDS